MAGVCLAVQGVMGVAGAINANAHHANHDQNADGADGASGYDWGRILYPRTTRIDEAVARIDEAVARIGEAAVRTEERTTIAATSIAQTQQTLDVMTESIDRNEQAIALAFTRSEETLHALTDGIARNDVAFGNLGLIVTQEMESSKDRVAVLEQHCEGVRKQCEELKLMVKEVLGVLRTHQRQYQTEDSWVRCRVNEINASSSSCATSSSSSCATSTARFFQLDAPRFSSAPRFSRILIREGPDDLAESEEPEVLECKLER